MTALSSQVNAGQSPHSISDAETYSGNAEADDSHFGETAPEFFTAYHSVIVIENGNDQQCCCETYAESPINVLHENKRSNQHSYCNDVSDTGVYGGFECIFPSFSARVERYSDAAMESAAATPVMPPVKATKRGCCRAKV